MQAFAIVLLLAGLSQAVSAETSPVSKVLDLLAGLQTKIIGEGEAAQTEYDEYAEWCEDRSRNVEFEIRTGAGNVEDLKAHIDEQKAMQSELKTKIEELAGGIATDTADLKSATAIRANEAADFAAEEKESSEVISTLERAIRILNRKAQSGPLMLQSKNLGTITEALKAMVQASMFSQSDASTLTALVQSSQESDDDSEDAGAPAAAVYEGQSGGVIETLEGLLEKAQEQLAAARQKETSASYNFQLLEQSLRDQLKVANRDSAAAKKNAASSSEKQAIAEGDLEVTSKDLSEDQKTLSGLHGNCLTRAQDFESATKSRAEELNALAAAKKVLEETSRGAASQAYGLDQVSFLQMSSGADLANFEAVRLIRDLAKKENSADLAQLASQMAAAMRLSSGSQDPFAKVKGLINEVIDKLENAASSDATHKGYCDKELAETSANKEDKETERTKLSTKIDQMSYRSLNLKEQVATLQKELAAAAKSQAEWDKFRQEENAAFKSNSAEMQQGLQGVKMALKVLRDYYATADKAHGAAEGSSTGIVGLLEVVESDFEKALAEMNAVEENAQITYEAATRENEIATTMKSKDVEYKVKEYTGLDKAVSDASSDRASVQAELDALAQYLDKLKEMCIAKAEPYEEKARRREAEISGLKEALQVLDGAAVLIQQSQRSLRGVSTHM
jgi:C4-type Zn-finger protein